MFLNQTPLTLQPTNTNNNNNNNNQLDLLSGLGSTNNNNNNNNDDKYGALSGISFTSTESKPTTGTARSNNPFNPFVAGNTQPEEEKKEDKKDPFAGLFN
eukprot:TRINITY_DN620_c2_g1_i3.p3 TRINITY_DN620_c2_g1~~TRINITY_DN620_c2_g1_i3.p3  ORF type:complete len:100 (+),score=52.25 TRINITY_DN620_c2_g1_i3:1113-1412(+)